MSKVLYIDDGKLEELFAKKADDVVIVDIRNPGEYSVEYIDGSINLPLDELLTADKNQFKDKIILFHCKGGIRTKANQHLLEAFASK
ncbi:MAG: rhodanese-like domain-containing protein, partial [Burkholderiales bacterium]|nr:rhodanese-like domain-containing protein [Burkholderiales bacterium]